MSYADVGDLEAPLGARLVVATPEGEAVGEVIVTPAQIVEVESDSIMPLLPLIRPARADERPPARASGAGAALFRSLGLTGGCTPPRDLQRRRRSGSVRPSAGQHGTDREDESE